MVPGDGLGHFCGLWVERRLPALPVFWKGPSLEKSKAGRVTEINNKKKNWFLWGPIDSLGTKQV